MKYLIDTQVLIWIFGNKEKLPKKVLDIVINPSNEIFVSYASFWELAIKLGLNKIELPVDLNEFIEDVQANQINILPIELKHIIKVKDLPFFHGDPFDRLIIAQSISEDLVLISSDEKFKYYKIKLLWE